MFNLSEKQIIVNDDSQVRLLEDDGTAYVAADVTPSAGGFILEGFLGLVLGSEMTLLAAATRIIKNIGSAGTAEVTSYVLTALSATIAADTVFRVVVDSLDLTPTEFQNRPTEKRYQIAAQTTVDGTGAALAAAINADASAQVTAAYTAGTDTLALTTKKVGQTVRMYVTDYASTWPAAVATTPGALPINTYDYLKNVQWAQNIDIDRNLNWAPLPGTTYTSYYFEVKGPVQSTVGSSPLPSQIQNDVKYPVKLYVKNGLTLVTALNLLLADLNV